MNFRYLSGTTDVGLYYHCNRILAITGYSDVDYAGCCLDRKSTSGTGFLVGQCLVSWLSKKQNTIALSTTEVEYIAVGSCCAQILWMRQMLKDYAIDLAATPILGENTSAINLTYNPMFYSRAKHIEVRHHFIRDHVAKQDVYLQHVDIEDQLADILTKPLHVDRFESTKDRFSIVDITKAY